MAVLDNAIWLTGAGSTAVNGDTVISEGGYSTTVTGTFTASTWDASQGGNNISEFGVFGSATPVNANYQFSEPVEDLSFSFNHVNDDGGSTYDDQWTIYAYDEDGNLIPAADVIAGLTGLVDENVITNPDGSVTIESAGTVANDVGLTLPGQVSELDLTLQPGSVGTLTGGSGISDLSFTIPPTDADGDGTPDSDDLDSDNDGILDINEGYSETTPSTITITFDGDQWASVDNTRWELRDPDGNLIASDSSINSTSEITNVSVTGVGGYTFTVLDDFGDGLGGSDPASYTIAVDGVVVVDSGANPNFGTSVTENFDVETVITTTDSDGDGIADHLDLDSDNDGITDNVEAQSTDGYVAPTGIDSDGDGVDNAYDATPTTGAAGSNGLTPIDTDSDGTADYLDTDSDNDGIDDVDEAGHGITQAAIDASGDADGDGIADVVDDVAGHDVNDADIDGSGDFTLADTDNDTAADGSGAVPLTSDLDFRDAVPCFTPGTLILTAHGEIAVENIHPGDMVMTVDNGLQPVRWVGTRSLTQIDLADRPNLRPIILRKNAFGNRRKICVSPQHAVIRKPGAADTLIRAKHAAEVLGGEYARIDKHCERVTYIHLMFDQHELIYAEGAQTESFYPGPMALQSLEKESLEELLFLFPKLAEVARKRACPADAYTNPVRPYMRRKDVQTTKKDSQAWH